MFSKKTNLKRKYHLNKCFKYITLGLNYVSCSPFRVPIARLAAARAAVRDLQKAAVATLAEAKSDKKEKKVKKEDKKDKKKSDKKD